MTSMELVENPEASAMTLYNTKESWMEFTANAFKQKPVKIDNGLTFPMRIINAKPNKSKDDSHSPSFHVVAEVGSLVGVKPVTPWHDPAGVWAMLPLSITPTKSNRDFHFDYPSSRYGNHQIKYVVLTRGRTLMLFTSEAETASLMTFDTVYALGCTASVGMMEISKDQEDISCERGIGLAQRTCGFTSPVDAMTVSAVVQRNADDRVSAWDSARAAAAAAPPGAGQRGQKQHQQQQGASVESSVLEKYSPTEYAGMSSSEIPDHVVMEYLSGSMDPAKAMCFEYEHPEFAEPGTKMAMSQRQKFAVNFKYSSTMSAVVTSIPGQSPIDLIRFFMQKSPETESMYEWVQDPLGPQPFVVVHRPTADVAVERGVVRPKDCPPGVRNTQVTTRFSLEAMTEDSYSQVKAFPAAFACYKKLKSINDICLRLTGRGEAWEPGTFYGDDLSKRSFIVLPVIAAFGEVVTRAFGISSFDAWIAHAVDIMERATFVIIGHVDQKSTAKIGDVYKNKGSPVFAATKTSPRRVVAHIRVDNILVDLPELVRSFTSVPPTSRQLPPAELVDAATAAKAIPKFAYPTAKMIKDALTTMLRPATLLTESPEEFAAAVKAECQFYIFTSPTNRQKYVWAVRTDVTPNASNAEICRMVLKNGGRYDRTGAPIVEVIKATPPTESGSSSSSTTTSKPSASSASTSTAVATTKPAGVSSDAVPQATHEDQASQHQQQQEKAQQQASGDGVKRKLTDVPRESPEFKQKKTK